MRLTLEIQASQSGDIYRVYDEIKPQNQAICGVGWAIKDAVDDFVEEFNRLAFYDDDTPIAITRDDINLQRIRPRPKLF